METIIDEFKKQCGEIYLLCSGSMTFHCTLCEEKYDGFDDFQKHVSSVHSEGMIKEESPDSTEEYEQPEGSFCQEEFLSEPNFTDDDEEAIEDIHTDQSKEYKEEQMQDLRSFKTTAKKTKRKRIVSSHNKSIVPDKHKFACNKCDYSTNLKSKLVEHLRRHSNDRPFVCDFCEQRFFVVSEKNRHRVRMHPETVEEKPISKEKLDQKNLIKSLVKDLGDNKFQCKECSYIGLGRAALWYHVSRRHSTYKPCQCTICPKSFYTKNDLRTHIRSHTGEKPFLCTECGNSYSTSSHLSVHLKRHNNIRDKECPTCHRRFFSSTHLQNHMAVHSDERPFACEKCSSTFKRKKTLSNHMKIHVKEHAYQCEICDVGFAQESGLRRHIIAKHTLTRNDETID